jgi:hypothetical protein
MRLRPLKSKALYKKASPQSILLLEPKEIPTTFFYVRSRIPEHLGGDATRRFDSTANPSKSLIIEPDTWVIIVRHACRSWLKVLLKNRDHLVKVTYLKDDDIPAVFSASELPWHYSLWTGWRFLTTRSLLEKVVSEVIVSTKELADRYPESNALLWEPHYNDTSTTFPNTLVYFYHATLTHGREMRWLVPIVRRVQKAVPNAWFEIIGDGSVARLFRGIPRVRCVHPMKWPNYHEYLGSVRFHVGLAPLMDSSFNRARSHTKLYQITRAGAAGIYSDVIPYSGKIVHGMTGLLVGNHRYLWVKTIIALLRGESLRKSIYENARIWCDEFQKSDGRGRESSGDFLGDPAADQIAASSPNRRAEGHA